MRGTEFIPVGREMGNYIVCSDFFPFSSSLWREKFGNVYFTCGVG